MEKGGEQRWQSRVQEERLEVEEKGKVSELEKAKDLWEYQSQLKEGDRKNEKDSTDIAY